LFRWLLLDGLLGQLQDERCKPLMRSLPAHPKHLSKVRPGMTPLNGAADEDDEPSIGLIPEIADETQTMWILSDFYVPPTSKQLKRGFEGRS
jgi:hypothetical protein